MGRLVDPHVNVRQIAIDWSPALLLFLVYNSIRGVINAVGEVNVEGIYLLEKRWFGWLTPDGEPLAFYFADVNSPLLTLFSVGIYSLHFFVPLGIFLYLGYIRPDREVFSDFRISLILLSAMGFATFILYPVAPPWYVLNYGTVPPTNFEGTTVTAAGLLKLDSLINQPIYGNMYSSVPPAPFAAFPSLHSGWSFLSAHVIAQAYRKKSSKAHLAYLYPLGVWFSTVYLQHHYIVDLVGGMVYALIAYYVGVYFVRPIYHYYTDKRMKTVKGKKSVFVSD
ncbi:MAG: phosphatase PAP2 family protein [Candidatus Kariarchaeaceae archaeon]|jgi:membrane-associated phospholipid phosphatase